MSGNARTSGTFFSTCPLAAVKVFDVDAVKFDAACNPRIKSSPTRYGIARAHLFLFFSYLILVLARYTL